MYKRILVPLDGSKLSEGVLPYVGFLAGRLRLPVNLLHVNDSETTVPSVYGTDGAAYLQHVAATFKAPLTVDWDLEEGRAAETIVDRASKDPGALITMATHGRSGAHRWLLGSVAQKVLQASINPLLLIRPNEESRPSSDVRLSSIILPLDGSHLAEKVFPHVVYLANHLNLEVVLIRTYSVPTTGYFMATGVLPPAIGELAAKIKQDVTEYLGAKVEQLQAEGIEKVSFLAVEGTDRRRSSTLREERLTTSWRCPRTDDPEWVVGSSVALQIASCVTAAILCW